MTCILNWYYKSYGIRGARFLDLLHSGAHRDTRVHHWASRKQILYVLLWHRYCTTTLDPHKVLIINILATFEYHTKFTHRAAFWTCRRRFVFLILTSTCQNSFSQKFAGCWTLTSCQIFKVLATVVSQFQKPTYKYSKSV